MDWAEFFMMWISDKCHTAPTFCSAITAFEEEVSRNSEDCRFLSYFTCFFLANPTGGLGSSLINPKAYHRETLHLLGPSPSCRVTF